MIAATLLLYLLLMETVFPKADWMLIIIIKYVSIMSIFENKFTFGSSAMQNIVDNCVEL